MHHLCKPRKHIQHSLVVLATCFIATFGQVYTFDALAAPLNRSLHTLYAFYIYSFEDAPDAHDKSGPPFIEFRDLSVQALDVSSGLWADYGGIQLSIMKYKHFWDLIDPKKFCCTEEDQLMGLCAKKDQLLIRKGLEESYEDQDVYMSTVATTPPGNTKSNIQRTGVYILVFSNCGDLFDATVTGQVLVRNSYGFLPGNEYYKMPFYGYLFIAYVFLALLWLGLCLRWWRQLVSIQKCIAVVVIFGLVESFGWWFLYTSWNESGTRGRLVFSFAIFSSVVKTIFSYMLVLVASLGWGISKPDLDGNTVAKICAVSTVYIILDFIRETVLSFRHSHSLSFTFVLLCLLPVSLLNGGIFYWVFTALSSLMEGLKDERQVAKLQIVERFWWILVTTLTVATGALLAQILDLFRSITARWKYQWLFADFVSHVLFLFVLAAMMALWLPNEHSAQYSYAQQIGADDDGVARNIPGQAVWADEEGLDDGDDDDDFWAATKGDVDASVEMVGTPSVIGVPRTSGRADNL